MANTKVHGNHKTSPSRLQECQRQMSCLQQFNLNQTLELNPSDPVRRVQGRAHLRGFSPGIGGGSLTPEKRRPIGRFGFWQ